MITAHRLPHPPLTSKFISPWQKYLVPPLREPSNLVNRNPLHHFPHTFLPRQPPQHRQPLSPTARIAPPSNVNERMQHVYFVVRDPVDRGGLDWRLFREGSQPWLWVGGVLGL